MYSRNHQVVVALSSSMSASLGVPLCKQFDIYVCVITEDIYFKLKLYIIVNYQDDKLFFHIDISDKV